MKALSFCVVDDILVSGLASEPPADEEWEAYLQAYVDMGEGERKVLVFTQGAGPTSAQRGRLHEILRGTPQRTAVVTASQLGRLMTAAVSWTNPAIRAFAPERVASAFDYLGIDAPRRPQLIRTARRLLAEVGASVSLPEDESPR
jgi:hypothetical protein